MARCVEYPVSLPTACVATIIDVVRTKGEVPLDEVVNAGYGLLGYMLDKVVPAPIRSQAAEELTEEQAVTLLESLVQNAEAEASAQVVIPYGLLIQFVLPIVVNLIKKYLENHQ